MVIEHSFWEVGDGEEVDFFQDSWQQMQKIQEEIELPVLQENLARSGHLKIKEFWAPNDGSSPFRQWKKEEWFKEKS